MCKHENHFPRFTTESVLKRYMDRITLLDLRHLLIITIKFEFELPTPETQFRYPDLWKL